MQTIPEVGCILIPMKTTHWTHWHQVSASLRLLVMGLAGLLSFLVIASSASLVVRLAISWVLAGSLYLVLSYLMMYFSPKENILALSKKEDDGAAIILLITVLASATSLIAIVIILSNLKSLSTPEAINHALLVFATYTISWLIVHTTFALHYAHTYYQEQEKTKTAPLLFSGKLHPGYIDFLYFSIVIGMTCQTADVNIASTRMRFLVMVHGMTAFAFNATLLVMAMNLISGIVALN